MKSHVVRGIVVCAVACAVPSAGFGGVLLYDNFDDGNYDGWTVAAPARYPNAAVEPPDVVQSPEGYALRGTREKYWTPDWVNWLLHPIKAQGVRELSIQMRAKSGPMWPNSVSVYLFNGKDHYYGKDYGEANKRADWMSEVGGRQDEFRYPIGDRAYARHNFSWTRDANGWWSLAIDGKVEAPNFRQDLKLTSFDTVGIILHRNQSEIEWVRVVPEPSALSLLALGGLSLLKRRR